MAGGQVGKRGVADGWRADVPPRSQGGDRGRVGFRAGTDPVGHPGDGFIDRPGDIVEKIVLAFVAGVVEAEETFDEVLADLA